MPLAVIISGAKNSIERRAMSGILLLKESEDYSGSLLGCFPIVELRVMYKKMMDKLGVMPVFNKRLLKKLKKILLVCSENKDYKGGGRKTLMIVMIAIRCWFFVCDQDQS